MRILEVVTYNPEWPTLFIQEKIKLSKILNEQLIDIHHIGSTSVPGLIAKPIIDILIVVKDINQIDQYNSILSEIGYVPKGENGIPNRRYFQKGGDNRTHHLHLYELNDFNITKHIAFRDYLITHPNACEQYADKKRYLVQQNPNDINAYIEGKDELVKLLEREAIEWYKNNINQLPKINKTYKQSVYAFILRELNDNIEILTYTTASYPNSLIRLPGGGINTNETKEEALFREVYEECGLTQNNLKLETKLGTTNYYKSFIDKNINRHDYLLRATSDVPKSFIHKVTGNDYDRDLVFNYAWRNINDWNLISSEFHEQLNNIRAIYIK